MATPLAAGAAARKQGRERGLRLFIALWPDASMQERLHADATRFAALGRQLPARNLHVTLAFLGSVPAARAGEIVHLMQEARPRACDLVLDKLAYFTRPRVLSVTSSRAPAGLEAYHRRLNATLKVAGLRVEARAFHPHITLLRDAIRPAPEQLSLIAPVTLSVREIALVHSELSSGGSRYEVLSRVPAPASGGY